MVAHLFYVIVFFSLVSVLVIGLITGTKRLFGIRMSAEWNYYVWLILMLQLLFFINPSAIINQFGRVQGVFGQTGDASQYESFLPGFKIASVIWCFGFLLMFLYAGIALIVLHIKFRHASRCTDPAVMELANRCRLMLRMKRRVQILCVSSNIPPVHIGLWKPKILLSSSLLNSLSPGQLQHVLMHELVHIKRRDLWLQVTFVILRCTHWFNPLIWFAMRDMKNSGEVACDAAVLKCLGNEARSEYGQTLIDLLRLFPKSSSSVGTLGMHSKKILTRRIRQIVQGSPKGVPRVYGLMLSVLLILVVAFASDLFQHDFFGSNGYASTSERVK
ncbi:M56 family metallopeptidase [Fontibacillus sp. BL9]|uniref:M56 family metallopeptidase n=1 Tax=Fontibacillus sp. BL9 TaxID=3389971 RepID=UPI00397E8B25